MAQDFSTNPPQFDGIKGDTGVHPVTFGTILKYGVGSVTVTGLLVDSYSRSVKYANKDEIIGQDGRVEGIRMSDARAEISVSGRVISGGSTNYSGLVGAILTVNNETCIVDDISYSAGSKDFVKVDIKGTAYENVTGAHPNMAT